LQVTGTNGDKEAGNFGPTVLPTNGCFRDPGNEIIEVEYDLYTGTPGTSRNLMGL
jgi:hypothetical protein